MLSDGDQFTNKGEQDLTRTHLPDQQAVGYPTPHEITSYPNSPATRVRCFPRTMTFGDPTDFAIEAHHEPSGPLYGGFGRMCIHIQGVSLGDIRENHCSLFHVTDRVREVAAHLESLLDDRFADLSDSEVFELIDREIYKGGRTEDGRSHAACGFLTNTGEMFDGVKTFVIFRPPDRVHILYRLGDDSFGSGSCSVQTFRRVADAYVGWFEEQVRTTAPPYFPINPFDLNEKVSNDRNGAH